MGKDEKKGQWLDSKQARTELEVSACDLSHIREAGKLRYQNVQNAYRYNRADIERLKNDGAM